MFKKGDLIKINGVKELENIILKVELVSNKLKSCIINHKGINYTIPFEYANKESELIIEEKKEEKIEYTGIKMLTEEEYIYSIKNGISVGKVVSSLFTVTDKGKDVVVQLRNDGSITYTYLKNGELTLKRYCINTKDFKYVLDTNKTYKNKLPIWITSKELNKLYEKSE